MSDDETKKDGDSENSEQPSTAASAIGMIIQVGFMGFILYLLYPVFSSVGEMVFGKDESAFIQAFTPGESTRRDYDEFNDNGGLRQNGSFLGYTVVEVNGLQYRKDGILRTVGFRLADFPVPVPKDIREKVGELCGGGTWKLISPSGASLIGYKLNSKTHECLYSYSTDESRSHNIVIQKK